MALGKSLGDSLHGLGQGTPLSGLYLVTNENKVCLAYLSQLSEKSDEITDEKKEPGSLQPWTSATEAITTTSPMLTPHGD